MSSLRAVSPDALKDVVALVGGSSQTPGGLLAPEVRTWLASPGQGLSAGIECASGVEGTTESLARLAPSCLTVVASVRSQRACWAEITRHGDAEPETCLAGLTYDARGRVSRVVWLRAP